MKLYVQQHRLNLLYYSNLAKYSKHSDVYNETYCNDDILNHTNHSRILPAEPCNMSSNITYPPLFCKAQLVELQVHRRMNLILSQYQYLRYLIHMWFSHLHNRTLNTANHIGFRVLPLTTKLKDLVTLNFHEHSMLNLTRHSTRPIIEPHKYIILFYFTEEFHTPSESYCWFITSAFKRLHDPSSCQQIDSFLELFLSKNVLRHGLGVYTYSIMQCYEWQRYLSHNLFLDLYSSSFINTYLNELSGHVSHALLLVVRLCEKVFVSLEPLMFTSTGKLSMSDGERHKFQLCYILEVTKIPSEQPHWFYKMVFISTESLMSTPRDKLKLPQHKPQSCEQNKVLSGLPHLFAFISLEHSSSTPREKLKLPHYEPQSCMILEDSEILITGCAQNLPFTVHIIHYTNNEGDETISSLIFKNRPINLWFSNYAAENCHEEYSSRTHLPHPRLKKNTCYMYNVCHSYLRVSLLRFDHGSSQWGFGWYKRTCTLVVIYPSKKEILLFLKHPFPTIAVVPCHTINRYFCHNPPPILSCHFHAMIFDPFKFFSFTMFVCIYTLQV